MAYRLTHFGLAALALLAALTEPAGAASLPVALSGSQTTAGGRACWATNWRAGQYLVAGRLPALAGAPQPAPVRVTVDYLDCGWGQWALAYEAWDGSAVVRRHGPVVQKHNTFAWKQASFDLPDFAGPGLSVDSFGPMVAEDDEYISAVTVRPGGVALLTPPVLAAGEKHALQALHWNPDYQPRAWTVDLSASAGEIQRQVATGADGKAGDFTYTAPSASGPVRLEAKVGESQTAQRVLVWEGHSPVQTESTLIDPSFVVDGWMYWPFAAQVTLAEVPEDEDGGAALSYAFTGPYRPGYVDLTRRTFLRGTPQEVSLEAQGDTHGARLQAILQDASGQSFCYDLGPVNAPEWATIRGSVQGPTRYWGGDDNGVPQYPLYFQSLRLVQGPDGSAPTGTLRLRDVMVRTIAPAP